MPAAANEHLCLCVIWGTVDLLACWKLQLQSFSLSLSLTPCGWWWCHSTESDSTLQSILLHTFIKTDRDWFIWSSGAWQRVSMVVGRISCPPSSQSDGIEEPSSKIIWLWFCIEGNGSLSRGWQSQHGSWVFAIVSYGDFFALTLLKQNDLFVPVRKSHMKLCFKMSCTR